MGLELERGVVRDKVRVRVEGYDWKKSEELELELE